MRSSRTITLFSVIPDTGQQSSSFVLSIAMHGAAIGLVSLGILYTPKINPRLLNERYTVRHLDLHTPEAQMRRAAGSGIAYPNPHNAADTGPGGKTTAQTPLQEQMAHMTPGPQTLVQADVHSPLKLTQETPVPTVVIWSPEKTPVKSIVPPKPEKPTAADVRPSVEPPNEEVNLADLGISATDLAAQNPLILPSTTSPVVVRGPELVQLPPVSTSDSSAQPTPATVLSLSDLHMPDGTVTLPPVNESASANSPGALAAGQAKNASQAGKGNQGGGQAGTGQGAVAGSGTGNQLSADHIALSRNGQFGAVVVGAAMEEKYPELAAVWNSRLAYTVYLHVGLAKSWILQYSLPRSAEAAAAGSIGRLEAPWPYNIVRPNIAAGTIDADALMVHGFVNQAGRFESLAITFPPEFAQAQFVLNSLEQWQFRPAVQNGQNVKVEVLLIIPEEPE
ncbi:MAG: hypothetical protein P4K94_05570 [Terracidiphilus sp.]|nr:hypothetical protein [Terracidiphilus sp.]